MTALRAQVVPPRPDSARSVIARPAAADTGKRARGDSTRQAPADTAGRAPADSTKRRAADSVKAAVKKPPRDTIKTPIAHAYTPRSTDIGAADWHWDRDQLFASGAMTLGELLASVPGVTRMTTGFLLAPQVAAYYGDPGRVRLYLDGVELDVLNPRNGGIPDLAMVPLWAMEDVRVERTAGELRVHLRLWRVERTTPNTRTDVVTGTENLNLYRGFFGKRFDNGAVLQFAGQQQSNISEGGMDGSALGGIARLGWARGNWSVDGTWVHQGIDRNTGDRFLDATPVLGTIRSYSGNEALAYLRIAWRDPDANGPWAQFIASTMSEAKKDTTTSLTSGAAGAGKRDSTDTLRSRPEYVLAAGFTRWGMRLSSTNRVRSVDRKTSFSPGARLEYASKLLTVSAFAERGADSTTREDASARFAPFSWLNVGVAVSRAAPKRDTLSAATTDVRLEIGAAWRNRWLTAGVISRTASQVAPPVEIDTSLRSVTSPAAKGVILSFRGPVARGFNFDLDAVHWNVTGPYRPQTQARARLWFESSFLHRFPRNNFHVFASGTYDYFSTLYVPAGTDPLGQNSAGAGIISTLLEIRISTAVIFWQYRNPTGTIYATYPGYVMPRIVNLYGVRWQFWN